jgi:hypothetical protein
LTTIDLQTSISNISSLDLPTVGTRTTLDPELKTFLSKNTELHLGGSGDFHDEWAHHAKVFGFHALPSSQQAPINNVEFTAIRGPHGTIPIRVFYPKSGEEKRKAGDAAALIYFHGGGYTVGTVDEFWEWVGDCGRGVRRASLCRGGLISSWGRFPTQFDEYEAAIEWLQAEGGKARGVNKDRVMGGGDRLVGTWQRLWVWGWEMRRSLWQPRFAVSWGEAALWYKSGCGEQFWLLLRVWVRISLQMSLKLTILKVTASSHSQIIIFLAALLPLTHISLLECRKLKIWRTYLQQRSSLVDSIHWETWGLSTVQS